MTEGNIYAETQRMTRNHSWIKSQEKKKEKLGIYVPWRGDLLFKGSEAVRRLLWLWYWRTMRKIKRIACYEIEKVYRHQILQVLIKSVRSLHFTPSSKCFHWKHRYIQLITPFQKIFHSSCYIFGALFPTHLLFLISLCKIS